MNLVREITGEVDKFLNDGKSSKQYAAVERTASVQTGTVVNASSWGDDKSYKAYCDKYMFVGTSGDVNVNNDGTIVYRYFYPILDVNYTVNGENVNALEIKNTEVAFFNLYIDDKKVATNVSDYCSGAPCGSEFRVELVSENPEYRYSTWSTNTGVMEDSNLAVTLNFYTRYVGYEVTCRDYIVDADNNLIRDITSEVDSFLYAGYSSHNYPRIKRTALFLKGEKVSGEAWGNDTSSKAYSNKYIYVGSSDEVEVDHDGITVYRYFYPILDVNGYIDGQKVDTTGKVARFNVYVDDELVAENVTDYCNGVPYGSRYNIEVSEYRDWTYAHYPAATDSDTMGIFRRPVPLRFHERTGDSYVIFEDWLVDKDNNRVREITSEVDNFLKSGESKNGFTLQPRSLRVNLNDNFDPSLFGNDERIGSYANEYAYAGASDKIVVETDGTKVYRYFYPVLDVNAAVDGEFRRNMKGVADFSLYVDGYYQGSRLKDFYRGVPCGSVYVIKNIRTGINYKYIRTGASVGIMPDEASDTKLEFESIKTEDEEESEEELEGK